MMASRELIMKSTNIEIKAKSTQQDKIRKILKDLGADFKGTDHQIDTYFNVVSGRLKLREGNIENALIHYERSTWLDQSKQISFYTKTLRNLH